MSQDKSAIRSKAAEFLSTLQDCLPELRESYGVERLGIFGSYVRGQEREGSDLDILIEFSRTPDLLEFAALKRHLSELLGVNVDLVMNRALKPHIGQRILQEAITI